MGDGHRPRARRPAPSRRFAAGIIALRPDRDGTIAGYEGSTTVQQRYGEWIIDAHLPPPGTPTQPVEAGYMANAWVRMRHPDYDALREMLDDVGRTVHGRDGVTNRRPSCGSRRAGDVTPERLDARRDAGEPFPIVDRAARARSPSSAR